VPKWLKDILTQPTTSVPLAGKAFGLNRNASYEAAKRGDMKTIKFGKRLVVPTAWLRTVLQLPEQPEREGE
jgi:hypothetical protein